MPGPRSIRETAHVIRDLLRAHVRTIIPIGAAVVVGVILLGLVAALYAQLIGVTAYQAIVASVSSIESLTLAVTLLFLPLVLLALLASLVWAGIAVQAANATISARTASIPSAAWRALRRSPRAVAVIAVTLGAALGAIVIAPLLVIAGIVGLLVTAPAEGSRFAKRWPSRGALIAMAIPFGVAVLVLVRWSLALPAVWLDGLGIRAALAESSARVRGRGPAVALVLVIAALAALALSEGLAALVVPLQGGSTLDLLARIVALILVGPLPFVALAVLYRRGTAERPEPLPAPATRRSRVAVAVVVSMIIPFMIGTAPGSATAAAVSSVTLTADATETVVGEDLLLIATVTAPTPPGGTVTFEAVPSVGATIDLGTRLVDSSGIVVLATADLPADEYQLQAQFSGDALNDPATSAPLAHTVHKATASVTVSSTPLTTGDQATFTATYEVVAPGVGTPSGTVTVSGGGHDFGPVALNASGVATLTVDVALAGTRELTVAFSGDAAFAPRDTIYTVPRIATTMNVWGDLFRGAAYGDLQTYEGAVLSASDTTPTGTVQLWAQGRLVAEDTLVAGLFSITSDEMRAGNAQPVFVAYLGDATHAPSDNAPIGERIIVDVSQAISVPVVSISSASPTIGDTVTVTATLDDLGVGPTGWITFYKAGQFQGEYQVSDGQASYELQLNSLVTWLTASYAGNINYTAQTSEALRVDAARAPVVVTIDDPGPLVYGQVFSLTANVSVAGGALTPDHGVLFRTPGGPISPTESPVVGGKATLEVCAAEESACHGVPALGSADVNIVAHYLESSVNLAGESAPFAYTLADRAETTTTLEVEPETIVFGSAAFLTATVTSSTSATPTGTVSFYGAEPVPGDPDADPALAYLGSAPVGVDGVARLETQSGIGGDDLRWPANGITAIYSADGALFESSRTTVPITIQRIGVTLDVFPTTAVLDQATPLEVRLSHDPGASNDFTGQVTITSDTGATCSVWVPAGERNVECSITWDTVGAHSYSATYSGDLAYAPGSSASAAVTVERPVSNLGASVPFNVVAGEDVTVTWQLFDPDATGTVTVWGDGVEWCSKPIAELSCVGRFGAASATGSTVPVIVRYSGDANFAGVQDDLVARVQGCVELDVRSSALTLGTVTVDTPSNCGVGRYLVGTTVTVTAHPLPNGEFVDWKKPGGLSLVVASTTPTTSFLLTYDSSSWVHVASFQVVCATVSAAVTGHGKLSIYPASNCTTVGGEAGYSRGTSLSIYPDGLQNPVYDDADVFYSWGPLPAGVSAGHDSSGRDRLVLTVQADVVVPVAFGPRCRVVTVTAVPPSPGDHLGPITAPNCHSPQANGFLPGTFVKVAAEPGLASRVLSGWSVDGALAPALGREAQPTVAVQYDDLAVTAQFVDCYKVEIVLDGANNDGGQPIGSVRTDPAPNCPDASGRFLAGTEVTLTPEVLVEDAAFNGWGLERGPIISPADGIGDVTSAIRQFVVSEDVKLQAGFYLESSCSRLSVLGDPSLLSFDNTGCGPGYYFDLQKQWANRLDVKQSSLWEGKYRSSIYTNIDPSLPLDVYASVRGDTRGCFGTIPSTTGPSDKSPLDWQLFGPLPRPSSDCRIGGPATFWVQACQTLVTDLELHVAGDTSGASYNRWSIPGTLYLQNADGLIQGFSMGDFGWVYPQPSRIAKDGSRIDEELAPGPCKDAGNAFPADTDLILIGTAPSTGIAFDGWAQPTGFVAQNPVRTKTTATSRTMVVNPSYTVTCYTVTFGEGVSILGDAPRCPGSSEADNRFIAGTAIQVRAENSVGGRGLEGFRAGIVGGQVYEDPEMKRLTGYAFVDGDKHVTAYYPSAGESFENGVIKGLKLTSGIFAVALPIFVGMLFPPAGILFGILGAAGGIAALIPGGDKIAAAFDLVNPTKITTCIARWSYANTDDPTGGANVGSIISTANTIRKVVNGVEVLVEPVGPIGAAGGAASFGYGLYEAGIGDADWSASPQTIEQLEDKATLTNCLDEQWRAAK